VPNSFTLGNINQHVAIIRLTVIESNKYLHCIIVSTYFQSQIFSSQTGAGREGLPKNKMDEINIPLPPLPEQHRIVAKVDELMALCDQLEAAKAEREQSRDRLLASSLQRLNDLGQSRHDGVSAQSKQSVIPAGKRVSSATDGKLQTVPGDWIPAVHAGMTDGESIAFFLNHLPRITTRPAHIKQLRQTILNLAVRGKLVAQDPNDEPAAELIKRIQAEKERLGLTPRRKDAKEEDIKGEEMVFQPPQGWQFVRFVDYALDISTGPFGSALHQSDYILDGVPLVNPSHMVNDRIIPDRKVTISEDTANRLATYRMRAGDIAMARRGEVGRAAIVSMVEEGWLCGTGSFFVRFNDEIFRKYILLLLRSDSVRKYLAGEAVGTTMVNLNHGIIKKMPLAIPPLAEQHRIVAKVDELMALCDQLEAQLTTTAAESRRLLEAVLHETLSPALEKAA